MMDEAFYHVAPVGDRWEVEDTGGKTIADTGSKEEAIEAAREAAGEHEAIVVHTADGGVEREIAAEKPAP